MFFLDRHPDYTLFFHNALVRYDGQNKADIILSQFKSGDFDTALLFEKWQLPLASVVMRKEVYDSPILEELWKTYRGGFGYFITATMMGKVYGLSECLSVYRKNNGGVSNGISITDVLYNHYGYAKVTNDSKVMKVVDNEAYRKLQFLIPLCIIGNKDALKGIKLVYLNNKWVVFKAALATPFSLISRLFTK